MHLKWLSFSCIFSGVLILTSWVCGESITASNLTVANRQSQNGQNNTMNDSIAVEKITFYSERSGNAEVYIMNADGSGLKRLTTNSALDNGAAISPDGSKIAFSSTRDGNYEIYVMNTDGSNQQRLTNTPYNEVHADWSPDGSKIAYALFIDPSYEDGDIYVMDADGSNKQQLTSDPAKDMRPIWSSDGSKIIFNSTKDGNHEIYTMNAYGSNQQRITNTEVDELFPCYSPDMTKIVYALVNFQTIKAEVHVMNADGTGDTALTNTGGINEDAIWSPDGKEIVFQSDRDGNYEVYKMAADGSNPRRLTNHSSWDGYPDWGVVHEPMNKYLGQTPPDSIPKIFAPGMVSTTEGAEYACAFTPDGTEFYFTRYDEATSTNNIWVTKLSYYNQWTNPAFASFTQGYSYNIEPSISPDGQKLFFISARPAGAPPSIWYVEWIDTGWSAPQVVEELLSGVGKMGPSVAANGNLYFCQHEGNRIQIYMSRNSNGVYETPVKLGDEINGFYIAGHPFIAPEENYLLFDACPNCPTSEQSYLYISFKRLDDGWYPAIKLNNLVNATDFQLCASVTPDGKYLFFDRGQDLYWVDAEALCVSGDADNSGSIDISDVIYLINYIFKSGPVPVSLILGDCNNDEEVTICDVVYLINYLFKGGPPPIC
jgi:TolB protein